MVKRVLIIGGYGNFGRFIAEFLAKDVEVQLILAGRDPQKAQLLLRQLEAIHPPEIAKLDISKELIISLQTIQPDIVIHTSGPFQRQGYDVARACIELGCHYMDLADGREFVTGITELDAQAKEKNVLICSGASSVPCLSGAIIDHYQQRFLSLEQVRYAIATAQLTNRGLATIRAVLSYAGKPFTTLKDGEMQPVYGWMGMSWRRFWKLNLRGLSYCNIPDLEIFPKRYPTVKDIEFKAGLELKFLHIMLFCLAGLVRCRLLPNLTTFSKPMLRASYLFDSFGKDDSGFYMTLSGTGHDGQPKELTFDLVARHGDGLSIPCVPSILLTQKLVREQVDLRGARPCLDIITLDEYLTFLQQLDIEWKVTAA